MLIYEKIERINYEWFIISYRKTEHLKGKKKYLFIGKSELVEILTYGFDAFMDKTMITSYPSRKALIERFKKEPCYRHLFVNF